MHMLYGTGGRDESSVTEVEYGCVKIQVCL